MWSPFRSGISRRFLKVILKFRTIVSHVNPLKKIKINLHDLQSQKSKNAQARQRARRQAAIGRGAAPWRGPSQASQTGPGRSLRSFFNCRTRFSASCGSVVCVRVARVSWCTRPVMSVIVVRGNQPTPIFCDPDPPIPCSNVVEVCLLSSLLLSRSVWLSSFSWGWFLLDYVSPLFVFHRFFFRNFDFSNWHIERIEIRRLIWPCSNFLTTLFREILNVVNSICFLDLAL